MLLRPFHLDVYVSSIYDREGGSSFGTFDFVHPAFARLMGQLWAPCVGVMYANAMRFGGIRCLASTCRVRCNKPLLV